MKKMYHDPVLLQESIDGLKEIGDWMDVNGPVIYGSSGREHFRESNVSFTYTKDGRLNAIYRASEGEVTLPAEVEIKNIKIGKDSKVHLLGVGYMEYEKISGGIKVFIPEEIRKNPPCEHAWSFVISN